MSSQSSSFPVSKFIFLIFLLLGAIVYFDVTNHGSFKASSTGRFTKDIGIYPHVESAIKHSKIYFDRSYDWGIKNIPVYYKKTVEVSKPYFASFTEYSFIVYKQVHKTLVVILSYAVEKLAFVSQWVEVYAPDLADRQLWTNIFDAIAHYSSIFLSITLVFLSDSFYYILTAVEFVVAWLQKNVFVGNLSSENLQKYAIQGIDAAFSYAAKAFIWVQDKLVSIYA